MNLGTTLRGVAIAAALMIASFGAYFFLYIEQHERELTDHHLRLLMSSGEYVSGALNGLYTNASNAVSISQEEMRRIYRNHRRKESLPKTGLHAALIDAKRQLIPGLELDPPLLRGATSFEEFLNDLGAATHIPPPAGVESLQYAMALDSPARAARLTFVFHRRDSSDAKSESEKLGEPVNKVIAWHQDLRAVIGPLLPAESFQTVLLIRANGEVILEQGPSSLGIHRLPAPQDSTISRGRLGLRRTLFNAQVFDLDLAGERYRVFLQPIAIPVQIYVRTDSSWRIEDRWFVAGLIPASRFQAMSMAIPPAAVLLVLALIALGLLSLPLVRVRFMGPRDNLRYSDLGLLAAATTLGCALATTAILYYVIHEQAAEASASALHHLASQVANQLEDELEDLDQTLLDVTKRRRTEDGLTREYIDDHGAGGIQPATPEGSRAGRSQNVLRTSILAVDSSITPFMEMVLWADSTGQQTSKWAVRSSTTPQVSIKSRRYFADALKGLLWDARSSDRELFTQGRFVESIRSLTTGREAAVLSRLFLLGADGSNAIAAIESRLLSVIGPVVPAGLGFAVVDREGVVQFHSDPARNTRERFFDELGYHPGLEQAVAERQPRLARTAYRTVPCLLLLTPIRGTPWSLITFSDERNSQRVTHEVLSLSLVLTFLQQGFLLLLAGLMFRSWTRSPHLGEPRRLWFWPKGNHPRYLRSMALLGALALASCAVILLRVNGWVLLVGAFLLPPAAVVLFFLGLNGALDRSARLNSMGRGVGRMLSAWPWKRVAQPHLCYAILWMLIAVLVGVLPTMSLVAQVHDEVQIRVLQDRQLDFFQAMAARCRERIGSYKDVSATVTSRQRIIDYARGTSSLAALKGFDTPENWTWTFEPHTGQRGKPPTLLTTGFRGALSRVGLFAIADVPGGFPKESALADTSRLWELNRDSLTLVASDPVMPGTLDTTLLGAAPPFRLTGRLGELRLASDPRVWGLGLLGLAVLFLVVRTSVHTVFLGDFIPPRPVSLHAGGLKRVMFLRCPTPADGAMLTVDTAAIRRAKHARVLVRWFERSGCTGIVLTQFDDGLKEADVICKKLELLEALIPREDVTILIASSIEPLSFLMARYEEHYEERKTLGISIDRWARVLQYFLRVRKPEEPRSWASGTPSAVLKSECEPTGVLKDIKRQIIARWDKSKPPTTDNVIEWVLDLAQAHYRRLWASCSSEEKLLLHRVATEGLVNSRADSVLRPLYRRGLVVLDPGCRLMNESFRRFVLSAERAAVFEKWQRRGEVSAWSRIRTPLFIGFVVLLVFFFATQREALHQTIGLAAAITAAVPGLLSILGGFWRPRGKENG